MSIHHILIAALIIFVVFKYIVPVLYLRTIEYLMEKHGIIVTREGKVIKK